MILPGEKKITQITQEAKLPLSCRWIITACSTDVIEHQ